MDEWVGKWVSEWVSEQASEWVSKRVVSVLGEVSESTCVVLWYIKMLTVLFNTTSRDTAGQERFRTLTNAYFRGAAVSCTQ